jgi:ABC-type transport system substrate-binding protein
LSAIPVPSTLDRMSSQFWCLLALSVGLTACEPSTPVTAGASRPFTIGVPDPLSSLEPAGVIDANTEVVIGLLFEGLTRIDSAGNPVPALAEQLASADQRRWRVALRPSATFHDGTPVRAADVLRSWQERLALTGPDDASAWLVELLGTTGPRAPDAGVSIIDSLTLQLTLTEPDAGLPAALAEADFWVRSRASTPARPIGSAPWRLVSGAPGDSLVRLARMKPDAVHIDTIEVAVFSGDGSLGPELGRDGHVDWTAAVGTRQYARLALRADVQLRSGEPSELRQLVMSRRRAVMRDPRVRAAIAHAVDRRALLTARPGVPLEVAWGILPKARMPVTPGTAHPYDPSRARALLREAGYDSARTPIAIGVHRGALDDSTSDVTWLVRNYLLAAGINAQLRPVNGNVTPHVLQDSTVDLGVYINYVDMPTDVALARLSFGGALPPVGVGRADSLRVTAWDAAVQRLASEADPTRRRTQIAMWGDSLETLALSVRLWWQPPLFACSLRFAQCPAQLLGNRFEGVGRLP